MKWSFGDITFKDERGKPLIERFVVEAKRGYTDELNPLVLIDSPKNKSIPLRDWWEKAWEEVQQSQRRAPMVIFKRNKCDPCIMLPHQIIANIELFSGPWKNRILEYYIELDNNEGFNVVNLFDFLQWTTPEDIIEAVPSKLSNNP